MPILIPMSMPLPNPISIPSPIPSLRPSPIFGLAGGRYETAVFVRRARPGLLPLLQAFLSLLQPF